MLVFNSTFPINPQASIHDLSDIAIQWRVKSPYSNITRTLSGFDTSHFPIKIIAENEQFGVELAQYKQAELIGIKHIAIESSTTTWTTEITGTKTLTKFLVNIRIYCNSSILTTDKPYPKKPYIFKLITNQLGLGYDGVLQASDKPIMLKIDDFKHASDVINGTFKCNMPCIYTSITQHGGYKINFNELAKLVSGMAHVFIEPDINFSNMLTDVTHNRNACNGAIGIYFPRSTNHWIFTPDANIDYTEVNKDSIYHKIREFLLLYPTRKTCSWEFLQKAITNQKIEALKKQGNNEIDQYIALASEEAKELKKKIDRLTLENCQLNEQLFHNKQRNVNINLQNGKEQDIYKGEIEDLIIDILEKELRCIEAGTRRHDIIEDLLKFNKKVGERERIEKRLKETLKTYSKMTPQIRKALETIGFSVEQAGKHYKMRFTNDERYSSPLAISGSDHRGGKNAASDAKKTFL
jgi:hypothetical protein